ncbi:MAG: thiamine diphosphokinase [Treponema sp.]|nr:thiamine diphosphokinase [Treponema sp.]
MQNPEQIHIVIFTGGSAPEYEKTRLYWKTHPQADYVIAADSGLETCASYAFSPCVIMGDFDSIQDRALLDYYNDDIKVPFDSDKDFTDTELAVSKAYEIAEKLRKTPFITLVGGDGGRIDHLLNIYDSFSTERHVHAWLCETQCIYYLEKDHEAEINGLKKDDYVSVARLTSSYSGGWVVSSGLEWESMLFRSRGMPSISNRISSESAKSRLPVKIRAEETPFLLILPHNAVVNFS